MNININLKNEEDISIIKMMDQTKINDILTTAITIGLKSIQMSNTIMDGNSYFNPIKEIIDTSIAENKCQLSTINDMLTDLLNIKNNSSRKGKLGESLAINSLIKKYPDWTIEDTAGSAHEGDIFVHSKKYGKILYEIKTYNTNVSSKEIQKFKNDVITTNSSYGLFISQTSGIVGKKMMDFEVYNGKILVYVSCSGLNGHGIEFGTEFLLSLIDIGYLDKRKIIDNTDINYTIDKINDKLVDLSDCINNFSRIKSEINRTQENINASMGLLYKHTMEYEIKGQDIYSKLLYDINLLSNNTNNKNIIFDDNIVNNYISELPEVQCNIITKIKENNKRKTILWGMDGNIIYILEENKILCKMIVNGSVKLIFPINNESITLDIRYENIDGSNIIIDIIKDIDSLLEKIIENRLKCN